MQSALRGSSSAACWAGTGRSAAGVPCTSALSWPALCRPALLRRASFQPVSARKGSGGSGGAAKLPAGLPTFGPGPLDRCLAALPYLLPFFDAATYGRYLFYMYPMVKKIMSPLFPAIAAYHSVPFAALVAFFGVYLGIVNNERLSRYVRFNAMQAALLDIVLVLPRLVESIFTPPASGLGAKLYVQSQSFIWIFVTAWVVYGLVNCLLGQWGRIPFIAEAADQQIR